MANSEMKDIKDKIEGIFFRGVVTGRSRRYVGENAKELCTYSALANGREMYIKQWEPNEHYFAVGEVIDIPIYIKNFINNGKIFTDLILNTGEKFIGGECF